ncbi:DNA mismatch repair protein MutT [Agarivorans sp. Toyoura001]|uniref:(deoxy)nucleoside triphosphate pyrophosphohydrolase n=1 Tax=Agarivorans sp. Toyoura001 TaxID=2283141 RepID=UPI0010E743B7|nr:(deoxy)nucleoside triphosphate pyrophosphohydrolase [Agarivorans sp. Toyoura001]GDY28262.1 DNA mismatch repair protein MutT [Agarivorans sp. Toyoura001]
MATIKVTCGIIFNDEGQVFICRRKPEKPMGGYWEFPGGKVEESESYEECLKRELLEELDMDVLVKEHFMTVLHNYGSFNIELISFLCDYQRSSYKLVDHDKFKWLDVNLLAKKRLAPADIAIAEKLDSFS